MEEQKWHNTAGVDKHTFGQQNDPNDVLAGHWQQFYLQKPTAVHSLLGSDRVPKEYRGQTVPRTPLGYENYEDARRSCVKAVRVISKQCAETNELYSDIDFDMAPHCLKGLQKLDGAIVSADRPACSKDESDDIDGKACARGKETAVEPPTQFPPRNLRDQQLLRQHVGPPHDKQNRLQPTA